MLPANAPTRTDLQLFWIGVTLFGGLIAGAVSPLSLPVGGAAGSLLAGVGIVDGVALHPPDSE